MDNQLTAIIIARNAAKTIQDCVQALNFCDVVIVGENGSQDNTSALAKRAGAIVKEITWDGYGKTKNKLIAQVETGWILSVDADERVTPELGQEIKALISKPTAHAGYWLSRRNYFLGQVIKKCGWSPDWQLRLFQAGQGRFQEKEVHEALEVQGTTGRLHHQLDHFTYATIQAYLERLNHYTSLAASDRIQRGKSASRLGLIGDPLWTFFKMYIIKSGWQDAFPGFVLSILSAYNTLVKHAKHWELSKK